MYFHTVIEHKIGFSRCHGLFRDKARKTAYYGADVEFLPDEVRYSRKEGYFRIKVEEGHVHLHMDFHSEFSDKKDALIALFFRPLKNLAEGTFQSNSYKVFGTGLSRTGTTSLHRALEMLGVFGIHHAPYMYQSFLGENMSLSTISEYDAFIDSPFSYFYKKLDKAYPGSKFIHTCRDAESWADSMEWLLGGKTTPAGQWFYGVDCFDRGKYIDRYLRHQAEVAEYFANRKQDFLTLELGRDDNWSQLCEFLGRVAPALNYPCLNLGATNSASPLPSKKILL